MNFSNVSIVLGSRSPRRLTLLRQIVSAEQIQVHPPRTAEELSFDGLSDWPEIVSRLQEIARSKSEDVLKQCRQQKITNPAKNTLVLTADTVIVAQDEQRQVVLGQPPEADWQDTVRSWFKKYLFGKTHRAATAVCLSDLSGKRSQRVAVSEVTFCPADEPLLEWYLSTQEPRGKAGGYGIQGAGSVFVSALEGSLSNVIGLPLRDVLEMLAEHLAGGH